MLLRLPICRVLSIFSCWCIYELMAWLFGVHVIFPLWCFIVEIFMHVDLRFIEDVTSISRIFVIFACFITLIEVGRYRGPLSNISHLLGEAKRCWASSHVFYRSHLKCRWSYIPNMGVKAPSNSTPKRKECHRHSWWLFCIQPIVCDWKGPWRQDRPHPPRSHLWPTPLT